MTYHVTLIPGDGTGPELVEATRRVLEATGISFQWEMQDAGEEVMAKEGTPLPDRVLDSIKRNGVALKGPITISVYNWSSEGHGSSTNKIKIEFEKTITIGLDQYSEKFPGDWNTIVTLVSVDITLDLALLELIFGTSIDEVKDFGMTYGSWGSQASAMTNGSAAASGFKNILGSTGKPGDFPNLDEAAKVFKGAAMLSTLVDDSGKALFPTFQNPGVQSLITTMCMNAAKDAKALTAVKNLMSLLGGMDMAKYTPPKP